MPRNYRKELEENKAKLEEAKKSLNRLKQQIAQYKEDRVQAVSRGTVTPALNALHENMIKNLDSQLARHLKKYIEIRKQRVAIKKDWQQDLIPRGNEVGLDVNGNLSSKALEEFEEQICIKERQNTTRKSPITEEKSPHSSTSSLPMAHQGYLYDIANLVNYRPVDRVSDQEMERGLRIQVGKKLLESRDNIELRNAYEYLKATPEQREGILARQQEAAVTASTSLVSDQQFSIQELIEQKVELATARLGRYRVKKEKYNEMMRDNLDLQIELVTKIDQLREDTPPEAEQKIGEYQKILIELEDLYKTLEGKLDVTREEIGKIKNDIKEMRGKGRSEQEKIAPDTASKSTRKFKAKLYPMAHGGIPAAQQNEQPEQPFGFRR